jgi:hypothetical protein
LNIASIAGTAGSIPRSEFLYFYAIALVVAEMFMLPRIGPRKMLPPPD